MVAVSLFYSKSVQAYWHSISFKTGILRNPYSSSVYTVLFFNSHLRLPFRSLLFMASASVPSSSPRTNPNHNENSQKESHYSASSSSSPPLHEHVQENAKVTSSSDQSSASSTPSSNPDIDGSLQISGSSILHLSFDQDHACFAAGTDQGFGLYNCKPFSKRDFVQLYGVGVVEVLSGCKLFALVGDGSNPDYPSTHVTICDNSLKKIIRTKRPGKEVRAVRLRMDAIIVVFDEIIRVFNLSDWKTLHQFDTIENPNGLCTVSQCSGLFVLASPGLGKGQIRVEHYTTRRTKFIPAHSSEIACLALSPDGRLVATASTKGTLVRIFKTFDGSLLQEVRRGVDSANIYSLAFSPNSHWLAVSSGKGTVHVFPVKDSSGNPAPSLSLIKRLLPGYFRSEWSFAQFHLPENIKYIVGFGQENNIIIIVGMDGSFYKCQFNPVTGGGMVQLQSSNFLSPKK